MKVVASLLRPTVLALSLALALVACSAPPTHKDPEPDPKPVVACTEPGDVVAFPDTHLRSFINLRLGLTDGQPILCGALDAVTQLNLGTTRPARSLEGVEHLRKVTSISFDAQNVLPDAEFARLANLVTVTNVRINGAALLRSIEFVENMPDLEVLAIDKTGLESLAGIEDLQGLRFMYIRDNPGITSAEPAAALRGLESVQITNSGLTSLAPFSGNDTLQKLMAAGNAMSSVSLSGMTSLTELSVANNRLSSVPWLSDMPNLSVLAVSGNNLTTLQGLENMGLTFLAANGNKITTIHHIADMRGIRTLNLADNLISNITPLRGIVWAVSGFRQVSLGMNCIEVFYYPESGSYTMPLGPNNDTWIELTSIGVNVNLLPLAEDDRCGW